MALKLGRKARRYDSRIPHLSALLAGQKLTPVPAPTDWSKGMPANLGMALNSTLGDCTAAGWCHQKQIWTFNTGAMVTVPDPDIEDLYEATGGYVPGDPSTDNGAVEQDVLSYLLKTGLTGDKLTAYFEVDTRNADDVKRTIAWCGGSYIGFEVPAFVMNLTTAGSVWDLPGSSGVPADADTSIEGGHCVVIAGFDDSWLTLISWGALYRMSWAFWAEYVDEAYGLVDTDWVKATGTTPANMTLAELEAQMQAIRQSAAPALTRSQLSWQLNAGVSQPVGGGTPQVSAGVSVSF